MGAYKLTAMFNFKKSPPCGFTESIEFNETTDGRAAAVIGPYQKGRLSILSSDWEIVGYRVSKLAAAHPFVRPPTVPPTPDMTRCIVTQTEVQNIPCKTPFPGREGPSDMPWAAILLEFPFIPSSPPVPQKDKKKLFMLRGIPDSWWDGAVLAIPGPAKGAITQWTNDLENLIGHGQFKVNAGCTNLGFKVYRSACIKRAANRKIGRPSDLLVGRRAPR